MIEVQPYFNKGILEITASFYEKEYNPSLDIIPKVAADMVFCAASIGNKVYGKKLFSSEKKHVQLVMRIAIPLILQMGIYFLVCKVRRVSHKVWLITLTWRGVEHIIDRVIPYVVESRYPQQAQEMQPVIDLVLSGIKLFTTGNFLSKAVNLRSPQFSNLAFSIPNVGFGIAAYMIYGNKKCASDNKFFITPFFVLGGSWLAHYGFQKMKRIEGPFLWKIELARQGISTIVSWLFHSVNSPIG